MISIVTVNRDFPKRSLLFSVKREMPMLYFSWIVKGLLYFPWNMIYTPPPLYHPLWARSKQNEDEKLAAQKLELAIFPNTYHIFSHLLPKELHEERGTTHRLGFWGLNESTSKGLCCVSNSYNAMGKYYKHSSALKIALFTVNFSYLHYMDARQFRTETTK